MVIVPSNKFLPYPNSFSAHSPLCSCIFFKLIKSNFYCPYILGCMDFHDCYPLTGVCTLRENSISLLQQLSFPNRSSVRGKTSCLPPFSRLGLAEAGFMYTVGCLHNHCDTDVPLGARHPVLSCSLCLGYLWLSDIYSSCSNL